MYLKEIIEHLALGAFVGCFILCLVEILISLMVGPENISFSGVDIINAVLGSIVVGFGFSLPSLVYEKEELPLPLQVLIQMGIGMTVLVLVAIYLQWMPIDLGYGPIIEWMSIAVIFAVVFWLGFYGYNLLVARDINKKLESMNQ